MFRLNSGIFNSGALSLDQFEEACNRKFNPAINPFRHGETNLYNLYKAPSGELAVKNGKFYINLISLLAENNAMHKTRFKVLSILANYSSPVLKGEFVKALFEDEVDRFNINQTKKENEIFEMVLGDCSGNVEHTTSIMKIFKNHLDKESLKEEAELSNGKKFKDLHKEVYLEMNRKYFQLSEMFDLTEPYDAKEEKKE